MESLEEQIKNYIDGDYIYIDVNENNENFDIPKNIEYLDVYISNKNVKSFTIPKHIKFLNLTLDNKIEIIFPEKLSALEIFYNIPDIKNLKSCKNLTLSFCEIESSLYFDSINSKVLNSIENLQIYNCNFQKWDLKNLKKLKTFEFLDSIYSGVLSIPDSIEYLSVQNLILDKIPESAISIYLDNCKVENFTYFSDKVRTLTLFNFNQPYNIPKNLENFRYINPKSYDATLPRLPESLMNLTYEVKSLNKIYNLPSKLLSLNVSGCENLYQIPKIPENLKALNISKTKINISDVILNDSLGELNINSTYNKKLSFLPSKLTRLDIGNTKIRNIPELPENLFHLNISNLDLFNLPNLPEKLRNLNCSYNELTSLPNLPKELRVLNCAHNELTSLPVLPEKINELDCSHNKLTSLPELPSSLSVFNFKNNPIYNELFPDVREIKLPYQERIYNGEKVKTITLPKGTVLFKGYKNPKDMTGDFIGFKPKDNDKNYLFQEHNVFLYPYPYVVEDVFENVKKMITFVLSCDVNIVLGLEPSENVRSDRYKNNYSTNCSNIELIKGIKGYSYDPCLTKSFMKENSDIMGEIYLAEMDVSLHNSRIYKKEQVLKYRKNFMDFTNNIGVPEVIMYPRRVRKEKPYVMDISEFSYEWLAEHMDEFNYFPLLVSEYTKDDKSEHINIMNQLLSPEGAMISNRLCHMTIDPFTSFYVIYECCEKDVQERCVPIEETNKLNYL